MRDLIGADMILQRNTVVMSHGSVSLNAQLSWRRRAERKVSWRMKWGELDWSESIPQIGDMRKVVRGFTEPRRPMARPVWPSEW